MRHLLRPTDFTTEEIEELICIAEEIEENPEKVAHRNYIKSTKFNIK